MTARIIEALLRLANVLLALALKMQRDRRHQDYKNDVDEIRDDPVDYYRDHYGLPDSDDGTSVHSNPPGEPNDN